MQWNLYPFTHLISRYNWATGKLSFQRYFKELTRWKHWEVFLQSRKKMSFKIISTGYVLIYVMLHNKSLTFSTGWIIICKKASRSDFLWQDLIFCEEHLLLVVFGWSTYTDLFRKISREVYIAFTLISTLRLQTIIFLFISELAHDNCTTTSLLFILQVFCSIYCLLSSWTQLQPLLHHLLCSNYPLTNHNYLAQ